MSLKLTTPDFLSYLQSLGITLWAEEDNLRFSAPKGKLTPSLRAELVERKLELLALLQSSHKEETVLPPSPDQAAPDSHSFVAPRTPTEKALAQIWKQTLGIETIGIYDIFFDQGGDSVLATQLVSGIRSTFQVELPLRDLFANPTIVGLAENIAKAHHLSQDVQIPLLQPTAQIEKTKERILSFAQQRSWFLDQLTPENPFYNMPKALRLIGKLDAYALEQTFNEIIRRHETLRTTFAANNGQPVSIVSPSLTITLPFIDLRSLSENERESAAQQYMIKEVQCPFDLTRGPLIRLLLLQLQETEHILLITTHHIVSDGWSTGVLLRELAALYPAFCAGKPSPLPELSLQYADFAAWQREWLQGETLQNHLSYWQRQLDNLPVLNLPTDYPRPPVQTVLGARLSFALPQTLSEQLGILSKQEGVTLFMLLLATFKTLLYRYTNQKDIVIGSPIANRNRSEIENLIGFFANMLVLRTDFSGNPTFRELLQRVREMALEAYDHQDLPFEKLVEELQPDRDLSRTPLFQVVFALQNAPMPTLALPGLTLQSLAIDKGTATFDLNMALWRTNQGLQGRIEYNTDLFEAATVTRMIAHFQQLLEMVIAHPEQRISDLPILTPPEQRQLLDWNNTEADYPRATLLHHLFQNQAEKTPTAVAVTFATESYTYQELDQRANQLAHYLQQLGVGPDALVGLCLERSLEMLVGLLGILKAGAAYLPLDPAFPTERLNFMLNDARCPVLLTQKHIANQLSTFTTSPTQKYTTLCLDAEWEMIGRMPQTPPLCLSTADNLAYIIYTSGSTGRPKGVQVLHRAVVNFLHAMKQQPGMTADDTLLSVTTLSFDIAVLELFLPLSVGGEVVLVSRDVAMDGKQLQEKLAASQATMMQATPATWRMLLAAGWQGDQALTILCGGEVLPLALAEQLCEKGKSVWNLYGPTETTIWSTIYPVKGNETKVSVGSPIANTQVYLLDAQMRPVPIGIPGALYIAGDGLARGYLRQPSLTAARFIPNPFSQKPGERLYRTGDQGRYLPDGNIEFLGRDDHQVKVRGFRIELGEIEAALNHHPDVAGAVVTTYQDASESHSLVAYVVPVQEQSPTADSLRDHLRETLPDYMVPAAFVFLESLPLTPNGKIDRQALPAPGRDQFVGALAFVAPSTPFEEVLAEIWEELLRLEAVSIHDNFFNLGGHSLLATQVVSRVRDRFEIDLPVRALFESPTIAKLGTHIEQILLAEIAALDEDEARHLLQG